jgi:regulator of sigma E protease
MENALYYVVGVVLVLGLMILVHELGHFLAARLFRVRVDVFSFGMGPRLFGLRRGPTDYRLSLFPIGGYVKLAGADPSEQRAGTPDEYLSRPRWQRATIACAGPVMNVVAAIVLMTAVFLVGLPRPAFLDQPARVGLVEKDSPAAKAGIQPGDLIVRLENWTDPPWEKVNFEVLSSAGRPLSVTVRRGNRELTMPVQPVAEGREGVGYAGWLPSEPAVIGSVESGKPASRAGLRPGDEILALDGQPVWSPVLLPRLQEIGDRDTTITIRRAGRTLDVRVRPTLMDRGGQKVWAIGVTLPPAVTLKALPAHLAFVEALRWNYRNCGMIFEVVLRLFERRLSLRTLGGPIDITRQSGEAAQRGLLDLVYFMALISLNLAVLNILPIPILDGGHILVLAVEGMIRRDLSLRLKERIVQLGLVFLILIFGIVMYNDILKLTH